MDVHAHLCDEKFEDVLGVIESAKKVGVKKSSPQVTIFFRARKTSALQKLRREFLLRLAFTQKMWMRRGFWSKILQAKMLMFA